MIRENISTIVKYGERERVVTCVLQFWDSGAGSQELEGKDAM